MTPWWAAGENVMGAGVGGVYGEGDLHVSEPCVSQNNSAASEHVAYSCILVTVGLGATISLFGLIPGSF